MIWFLSLNPILQGLLATLFTWFITALGSSVVFFFKDVKKSILNSMLGFGAGVMIAASFWSLLNPAIELCEEGVLIGTVARIMVTLCWKIPGPTLMAM